MKPAEMNAIIAQWCEPKPSEEVGRKVSRYRWESVMGFWTCTMHAPDHLSDWEPKPLSSSRDLMALAEKVVEDRVGITPYVQALMDTLAIDLCIISLTPAMWYLATATASERAKAMTKMIQEGEND